MRVGTHTNINEEAIALKAIIESIKCTVIILIFKISEHDNLRRPHSVFQGVGVQRIFFVVERKCMTEILAEFEYK